MTATTIRPRRVLRRTRWRCASSALVERRRRREESAFARVGRARVRGGPLLRRLQAGAPIELALVVTGCRPRGSSHREVAVQSEAVAVVVEPTPQPRPALDERLVGDLHRRLTGLRLVIEGEQARFPVPLQDPRRLRRLAELGDPHAPSGVLGALAESHQPEEGQPRGLLLLASAVAVERLGPPGDRTAQLAHLAVRVERQHTGLVAIEQLRRACTAAAAALRAGFSTSPATSAARPGSKRGADTDCGLDDGRAPARRPPAA